jgi:integrase
MGVKVKFHRGAWWVFINHNGRRKAKKVGERAAAETVGRAVRERLARTDLQLPASDTETLQTYAKAWMTAAAASLKA